MFKKLKLNLCIFKMYKLQSNQVKRAPQDYTNEQTAGRFRNAKND